MLTRQCPNSRGDDATTAHVLVRICIATRNNRYGVILFLQLHVSSLPPVQLGHFGHAALKKPLLVAQGRKIMCLRKLFVQPLDGRVTKVIIVIVTDNDGVYNGYIFYFARRRREPL